MKVKDLLAQAAQPPRTSTGDKSIREAMKILVENKIGSLIIVDDDNAPVGIITERDIFRLGYKFNGNIMQMKIADYMTRKLIIGVPDDDIDYIARVITQKRIRHIPIMDENKKLCGILSIGDILKAKLEMAEVHLRYLTEYITGRSSLDSE
jgi:CBS domain-containing protein